MSAPAGRIDRGPSYGRRLALRLIAAGVIVLVAVGTAVATSIENTVGETADLLKTAKIQGLEPGVLDDVEPGKPQTILLVGDDHRYGDDAGLPTRSDTMILLRLDPDAKATTMLSLPRDLLVGSAGTAGRQKLNAAFSGGPKKLIRTIQSLLTTPDEPFRINHIVSIRFTAFAKAVNYFKCFYVDIDRTYFNDNTQGGAPYATIDVPSGYQRLCGEDSLDYVRFRHLDNDLVRESRQSNYLSEARGQIATSSLLSERNDLVRALRNYLKTDITSTRALLGVVRLAVDIAGKPSTKVTLETTPSPDGVDVEATPEALEDAARRFLNPGSVPGGTTRRARDRVGDDPATTAARPKRKPKKRKARTPGSLQSNAAAGEQAVAPLAGETGDLPVYYPTLLPKQAAYSDRSTRGYRIQEPGKKAGGYASYRLVSILNENTGQYYGVQGTAWKDPPILKLADDEEKLGGRTFRVQYDGKKIRKLIWRAPTGTYWVSNTLSNGLSNAEMRAIARSLTR